LIDMQAVTVRYGETMVLDRFSWTVMEGEHWALTGPNGAGKSTILKLITGECLQVYANRIRLFGRHRGTGQSLWEIRERLGVVSHDLAPDTRSGCLPWMWSAPGFLIRWGCIVTLLPGRSKPPGGGWQRWGFQRFPHPLQPALPGAAAAGPDHPGHGKIVRAC
jgi:hypothetical protein